ncbi:MAG: MMPL family transporter [Tissierellia bacterium]|nr:MMPL family transporter [Tissierellia bacterium]
MKKVAHFIVGHKGLILTIFIILSILGTIAQFFVPINYNLADYIPDSAPSTQAIHIMEKEYDQAIPNLRVYVPDLDLTQALVVKEQIGQIVHVRQVLWLDDFYDLKQPLELAGEELLKTYYKDKGALFMVVTGLEDTSTTLENMQELIGETGSIEGQVVDLAKAQSSVDSEMFTILLIMAPLGLMILNLATGSWIEPLLLFTTIGAGVLMNMGSNIVLDSVSFITAAVSAVLQLAVSMDYAVFLLHRFGSYRQEGYAMEEAMEKAIVKSSTAIIASASTTVLGFLALVFMGFKIGPDLGIVLAKGVMFSLISVVFLLPVLVLYSDKLILKTSHRPFLPSFALVGRLVKRVRYLVLILILIAPIVFIAQQNNSFIYGNADYEVGSREERDRILITEKFGNEVSMAIMVPRGQWGKEKSLEKELESIPGVLGMMSYTKNVGNLMPSELIDKDQLAALLSENYSRIILTVRGPKEGEEPFFIVEQVRAAAAKYYGDEAQVLGESVVNYDMKTTVEKDNVIVNGLAIVSVGLVLLINFKSLTIPLLLLLTIESSIWINLAVPYFTGTSLTYIGYLIISTLQLGATVDYGILFTQHYLDNRKIRSKKEAIYHSFMETIGGLLPPALILISAGYLLYFVSSLAIVSELGLVLGRGALTSFLMVIFYLPGLLNIFDPLIEKTTLKAKFYKNKE